MTPCTTGQACSSMLLQQIRPAQVAIYSECLTFADGDVATSSRQQRAEDMAWGERLFQTVNLWPYMVPLVAVYFAEYAMQTGTWTAIGKPYAHDSNGPEQPLKL